MKLVMDFNNLVIVGLWNRHIFNLDWVGKYLLPETELTSEYPLNIEGSIRVSSDKLRIFVVGNRLHFVPLQPETTVFDLIQDLSLKIGTYLPHTPITAFGVNFLFEAAKIELAEDFFAVPDLALLNSAGFEPISTAYKHSFNKDGRIMNLSVSTNGEKVSFDFNNHFEVKSLIDFKERISQTSIISMLQEAEALLSKVYVKNDKEKI